MRRILGPGGGTDSMYTPLAWLLTQPVRLNRMKRNIERSAGMEKCEYNHALSYGWKGIAVNTIGEQHTRIWYAVPRRSLSHSVLRKTQVLTRTARSIVSLSLLSSPFFSFLVLRILIPYSLVALKTS
jgi:hypothetical protein